MQAPSDDRSSSAPTTQPHDAASQQPQPAATELPSPNFVHTDETYLKRSYLRLLPPVQVVEICLSFDPYVPPEVKNRIWPVDFHSAIAALQLEASVLPKPPSSSHDALYVHTPAANESVTPSAAAIVTPIDEPPMDSLQNPATMANKPTTQSDQGSSSSTTNGNPPESQSTSESQPVAGPSKTSTPVSTANAYAPTQPPYPHVPYGYHPHLYPQASYYGHPPAGYTHYPPYPAAYPHYPSYPPNPHTPPVAPYQPPAPMRPQLPGDPPGMPAEDLPSYEDMIVEALTDCADPDGLAPKNMFQWMAARYPLQSNFRPSASQALQKAFKRGRLEKSNDGKYRLNASWEGGSTSKRTTRRPQTQTQVTLSQDPQYIPHSKSPFTHTPLAHRAGSAPANTPGISANYNSSLHATTPYPYNVSGYPGYQYSGYPPPTAQAQAQIATAASTSTSGSAAKADVTAPSTDADHLDAWEAAQNILKAINFGSLLNQSNAGSSGSEGAHGQDTVSELTAEGSRPALTLTDEEKAALQAQLALLAAQLEEIAEEEEALVSAQEQRDSAPSAPLRLQSESSGEQDEDDVDMEMVDVSLPVEAPRT